MSLINDSNRNLVSEMLIYNLFLNVAFSATLIIRLWSILHPPFSTNFATCPMTSLHHIHCFMRATLWNAPERDQRDTITKSNQKTPSNKYFKVLWTCAGKQHQANSFLLGSWDAQLQAMSGVTCVHTWVLVATSKESLPTYHKVRVRVQEVLCNVLHRAQC